MGFDSARRRLGAAWAELAEWRLARAVRARWRRGHGLLVVAVMTAAIALQHIMTPGKYPDFTVFWAAGANAFGKVYDGQWLTGLQQAPGYRPFAYPPTFLLMLWPVGQLPFRLAYVLWVTISVTAFVAVAQAWSRWGWLAIWSPTLIFAALIGQTTLWVGAAASLAIGQAEHRPRLAGGALGLALCIKPQLVMLVPFALLLWRAWPALTWAALTGGVLVGLTTMVFGLSTWLDWVNALHGFIDGQQRAHIERLGLWAAGPIVVVGAAATVVMLMALAARRADRAALAVAALGGSMLISPHAAFYDSAVILIPALAMTGLNWKLAVIVPLLLIGAETPLLLAAATFLLALPRQLLTVAFVRPRRGRRPDIDQIETGSSRDP